MGLRRCWSAILLSAALFLAAGCVPQAGPRPGPAAPSGPPAAAGPAGGIFLFADLEHPRPGCTLTMGGVAGRYGDQWQEISGRLSLGPAAGNQYFLGRAPAGAEAFRLRLADAACGDTPLAPEPAELVLQPERHLAGGESSARALFFRIDLARAFDQPGRCHPRIRLFHQDLSLTRDLLLAASPAADTVFVVSTAANRVIGAMGVPGGPSRAVTLPRRQEALVLGRRPAVLTRIDLTTGAVRDRVVVPLLQTAMDMVLLADDLVAVLGDDNLLVTMDPFTGTLAQRRRLGQRLVDLAWRPATGELALASSLTQEVILLSPTTLTTSGVLQLPGRPNGLAVTGDALYVAEADQRTVSRYGGGAPPDRRHLTTAASHLTADDRYLWAGCGPTLEVLRGDTLTPVQRIMLPGIAGEMALDPRHRWLYIALQDRPFLAVVDTTGLRLARTIPLGGVAGGLTLLQDR